MGKNRYSLRPGKAHEFCCHDLIPNMCFFLWGGGGGWAQGVLGEREREVFHRQLVIFSKIDNNNG